MEYLFKRLQLVLLITCAAHAKEQVQRNIPHFSRFTYRRSFQRITKKHHSGIGNVGVLLQFARSKGIFLHFHDKFLCLHIHLSALLSLCVSFFFFFAMTQSQRHPTVWSGPGLSIIQTNSVCRSQWGSRTKTRLFEVAPFGTGVLPLSERWDRAKQS